MYCIRQLCPLYTDSRETYLTGLRLRVLLLDLDFADVARVLNDLGNVRLVSSTNLTRNTLAQVSKSAPHPVLPENTDTVAERRKVRLDHAEGSVDGPEEEEDGEEMMGVPEAFELGTSVLFGCCPSHGRECNQHDVSCPSGTCCEICEEEAHETELVSHCEHPQIPPMRNRVDPGKEEDRPAN